MGSCSPKTYHATSSAKEYGLGSGPQRNGDETSAIEGNQATVSQRRRRPQQRQQRQRKRRTVLADVEAASGHATGFARRPWRREGEAGCPRCQEAHGEKGGRQKD